MSKMLKFLAIDLGASSGRAMLGILQNEKIELTEIHRFSNDPVEIGGSFYWDILRLFHEIKQGLIKCANLGHKDITAIGVDTWGVDFGLLDKNGRLIGNPYHYRDARTDGMMEEASKKISDSELYSITGIQFMNLNTIYQLYSMVKNNDLQLQNAESLLFTPDLLNYFLTGQKACEYSIASTSALVDAKNRVFSDEILSKLSIPKKLFSKIVSPGTIVGKLLPEIAKETGLSEIPVIATASHDTAAAVVSVPASCEDFAYLSSGTWSLMGIESKEPIINLQSEQLMFTNEGGADNTIRFLKNIMGMWLIQECKRHWDREGINYTYDELDKMAEESEAFYSYIDLDDNSFLTPKDMPNKIISFCQKTGQRVPQTDGQIIRCVYDSLALKYKDVFHNIEKIISKELSVLHIVGGGIKNKLLCQFTANAIGKKVVAGPVEATAIGNIMIQAMGVGAVKSISEIRKIVSNSTPLVEYISKDIEKWETAYKEYKKIVK